MELKGDLLGDTGRPQGYYYFWLCYCNGVRGGTSWHHKGIQGLLCRSPPFTRIPFAMQWAHVWCKYYAATMRHLMITKVCTNWSRLDGDGANGCFMEMKSIISRVYYRPECLIPEWLPTQMRELWMITTELVLGVTLGCNVDFRPALIILFCSNS